VKCSYDPKDRQEVFIEWKNQTAGKTPVYRFNREVYAFGLNAMRKQLLLQKAVGLK